MTVTLERRGRVWILDLGDAENWLMRDSMTAILHHLDVAEQRGGPLITTGRGKFFCNGMDVSEVGTDGPDPGPLLFAVMAKVLAFPAFTLAAVNGHAFGGGAILAAAHDRAFMRADRGFWCIPEVDLGMPLDAPLMAVLADRLPAPALTDAVLTGRRFTAADAVAAGVVDAAVRPEELLSEAVHALEPMADKSPTVVAAHKRLIHAAALSRCREGIAASHPVPDAVAVGAAAPRS